MNHLAHSIAAVADAFSKILGPGHDYDELHLGWADELAAAEAEQEVTEPKLGPPVYGPRAYYGPLPEGYTPIATIPADHSGSFEYIIELLEDIRNYCARLAEAAK